MVTRRARAAWSIATVAAALCGAPAAHAATARLCPVLTDAAGDATVYVGGVTPDGAGAGTVPDDQSLDIRAVDLSLSGGRRLVASMKVAKLAAPNPQAPLGQYYSLSFRIGENSLVLDGVVTPLGNRAWIGRANGSNLGGDATYASQISVNTSTQQVVLTTTLADVSHFAPARKGTKLTHIEALTQRIVGASYDAANTMALVGADRGVTTRAYVVGTPTRC